jgi:DNA helicase-2/ATP-dependent DNA helicase PcrA
MLDLSRLNPPQRRAVRTLEGPLLVLAGAGSGKTRVIVHRIAYMVEQGIAPEHILAVTFTNKAAAEMRERVGDLVGSRVAKRLTVNTFHAFGCEVLRRYIDRLGWPRRFAIADGADQLALLKRCMREVKIDDRAFDAKRVLALVSRAKCAGAAPKPKAEGQGDDYDLISALVFPRYELALKAQALVDFDDLILLPIRLLREHADVREALVSRYRYLLVDEYQDTNRSQLELLVLLAGEAKNVCAVGDDDQSIYSWRGAEVENILSFDRHFPNVTEVRLEQNYRSTSAILAAANAVIAKNEARKEKRLWTALAGGDPVQIVVCPDEEEEGRYIAREIARLVADGRTPREIAVLYRTNLQARALEEALRAEGLAYELVGGQEFFDKREIKDVVAYLKICNNWGDEVSLLRIVNVPPRGIGDTTLERLGAQARARKLPLEEAMRRAAELEDLPRGAAQRFAEFLELIDRYRQRFREGVLDETVAALVEEVGIKEAARQSVQSAAAGARRAAAGAAVLDSGRRDGGRDSRASLDAFLKRLALDGRDDDGGPSSSTVTLMTLHAAKGLEWPVVFLCGAEEDLLPHAGMQGEAQNLPEERRLAYVGITRARERLYITRSAQRVKRGQPVPRTPSRFLDDLPKEVLELVDHTAAPKGPPGEAERSFFTDLRARLKSQGAGPK